MSKSTLRVLSRNKHKIPILAKDVPIRNNFNV